MTHEEDISRSMLFDAMHEAVQAGIAAGIQHKKTIEGKTIEAWINEYIINLIGPENETNN